MARRIIKSPYIKGSGKAGGRLRYAGPWEGAERLLSGYGGCMAGRQNSRGLFGAEEHGPIPDNPADQAEPPKVAHTSMTVPKEEQLDIFTKQSQKIKYSHRS